MLSEIQKLRSTLPGIDCGACGAPTCLAFAEDVIKGNAKEQDCIIKYKSELQKFLESKD